MEAATAPSANARSEFANRSGGNVGYIVLDNGKEKAMSLPPEGTVLLTAQEQILTANAPTRDEDNPFTNGSLVLITPAAEIANRRQIGDPSLIPAKTPEQIEREQAEADAARAEAEARKAEEAARAEAEAERLKEAQRQGEQGAQPRVATPPAKSEGEGAVPAPQPQAAPPAPDATEETAQTPQGAGDATGERAKAEEVATPAALGPDATADDSKTVGKPATRGASKS